MLSHIDIYSMMKLNFGMVQHHKYSFTEIENMIPWERDVYVDMLIQHVRDENQRLEMVNQKMR